MTCSNLMLTFLSFPFLANQLADWPAWLAGRQVGRQADHVSKPGRQASRGQLTSRLVSLPACRPAPVAAHTSQFAARGAPCRARSSARRAACRAQIGYVVDSGWQALDLYIEHFKLCLRTQGIPQFYVNLPTESLCVVLRYSIQK